MDRRLVAWGRAVKARNARRGITVPPLWLFTDEQRLADPRAVVARLPLGLFGVVLRHDGAADRAALGRDLARICRERRLVLVVAGDGRLAWRLRAGVHLRGGRGVRPSCGFLATASVHSVAEAVAARRCGATLGFISPLAGTLSHPGARPLGALRWAGLARHWRLCAVALGGVDGVTIRCIANDLCHGAAAIGAWL